MLEPDAHDLFDVFIDQRVEDVLTVPAVTHDRLTTQDLQVLRDRGFRHLDHGGEVRDTHLAAHEEAHNLRPRAVPQRAERFRQRDIDLVVVQGARAACTSSG